MARPIYNGSLVPDVTETDETLVTLRASHKTSGTSMACMIDTKGNGSRTDGYFSIQGYDPKEKQLYVHYDGPNGEAEEATTTGCDVGEWADHEIQVKWNDNAINSSRNPGDSTGSRDVMRTLGKMAQFIVKLHP